MSSVQEKVEAYREAVAKFEIFDTAMWWCPEVEDAFVCYKDWDKQVADFHAAGLNAGLVTSRKAATFNAEQGNEDVAKMVAAHPEIKGCIVVTPDMFLYPGKGEAYLKEMHKRGVVAARMYPGGYYHSSQEWCIGPMMTALENEGLPLLVSHIDTGWDAMARICDAHPRLNVVVESQDRKLLYHARDYLSLLKRFPNFYVETHNLVLFNEYENIYDLVGDGQLLYGSYFPYAEPNFSIYPIFTAKIPDSAKQAIYAGNAKRIFHLD